MNNPISTELLARADANFSDAWQKMMTTSPKGDVTTINDLTFTHCGLSIPFFNTVFTATPRVITTEDITIAKRHFSKTDKAFQFIVHEPSAEESIKLLKAKGFVLEEIMPGMAFSKSQTLTLEKPTLDVITVENEEQISAYQAITAEAYELPDWLTKMILNPDFLQRPDVHLYLGLIDGVAVATSMLVSNPHSIGIYWVATANDYRKKGYGESMTAHATKAALNMGYSEVILQASAMGEPLYQRMGFFTLCQYQRWIYPSH